MCSFQLLRRMAQNCKRFGRLRQRLADGNAGFPLPDIQCQNPYRCHPKYSVTRRAS